MLPLTPTFPVLRTSNATTAVLRRFRSSWTRKPIRSLPRSVAFVQARLLAFALVHRDRARDRLVKASVERAEIFRADRRVRFHRQIGHRLTDVAIIVNDLRDREPLQEQVVSVLAGAPVDLQVLVPSERSVPTS